jgi:DNA (cytosine-5)-methyltransferase 1
MKPRLLDLFCGAGGAGMGYYRAGFEVVGVDVKPQPRYPFEFHQADAMTYPLEGFDAIHASPPCQAFSVATLFHRGRRDQHPNHVPATRQRLQASGVPFAIENVLGAPLINPVMLCGTMFPGLKVYRHRLFECNPSLYFPPAWHNPHMFRPTPVGRAVADHGWMTVAGHFSGAAAAGRAMGIDWMNRAELAQAIPPEYTEWIGQQLLEAIR